MYRLPPAFYSVYLKKSLASGVHTGQNIMVCILNASLEQDAHVLSKIAHSIFIKHSFTLSGVAKLNISPKRHVFLYTCAICSDLPFNLNFTSDGVFLL